MPTPCQGRDGRALVWSIPWHSIRRGCSPSPVRHVQRGTLPQNGRRHGGRQLHFSGYFRRSLAAGGRCVRWLFSRQCASPAAPTPASSGSGPQGLNRYAYVNNSLIIHNDLKGHDCKIIDASGQHSRDLFPRIGSSDNSYWSRSP
jgi:hypothetical protein